MFSRIIAERNIALQVVYATEPVKVEEVREAISPVCGRFRLNPEETAVMIAEKTNKFVKSFVSIFLYEKTGNSVHINFRPFFLFPGMDGEKIVKALTSYSFLFDSLRRWLFSKGDEELEKLKAFLALHQGLSSLLKEYRYPDDLVVYRTAFKSFGEGFKVLHQSGEYCVFRFRKDSGKEKVKDLLRDFRLNLLFSVDEAAEEAEKFREENDSDIGFITSLTFFPLKLSAYFFRVDVDEELISHFGVRDKELKNFALYTQLLPTGLRVLTLAEQEESKNGGNASTQGRSQVIPLVFKNPKSDLLN